MDPFTQVEFIHLLSFQISSHKLRHACFLLQHDIKQSFSVLGKPRTPYLFWLRMTKDHVHVSSFHVGFKIARVERLIDSSMYNTLTIRRPMDPRWIPKAYEFRKELADLLGSSTRLDTKARYSPSSDQAGARFVSV